MADNRTLTAEWQFVATLSVDGARIDGNWDAIDGGDTTSEARPYRAGGNIDPEVMPGVPRTGDVTLERAYRGAFDGSVRNELAGKIGKRATVQVYAMSATDRSLLPGSQETIRGVLKEVTRPAFRSEGEGVALYRVVVTPDGHWVAT